MFKKYGKSAGDILKIKKSFFEENGIHLSEQTRINKIFLGQPRRVFCKTCDHSIEGADFVSHGVPYKICEICGHLNGMHQETLDFYRSVYVADDGKSYGAVYLSSDKKLYQDRVNKIYIPKVEFLESFLETKGYNENKKLSVVDFGAGSGYMVSALLAKGYQAIGLEVSKDQVKFGNEMIQSEVLKDFAPHRTIDEIMEIKAPIVCLIGVLEHVPSPRDVLKALSKNKNIKYIYFSLPLFSTSVFFEIISSDVYNRQLGGGHTHLYTSQSIDYFCEEYSFKKEAEWLFGTDMMDLYRHMAIKLKQAEVSSKTLDIFNSRLSPLIDGLQDICDRAGFCSESHFILSNEP